MIKPILAIAMLIIGSAPMARGQQTSTQILSEADKTAIVKSVLDAELKNQISVADFEITRQVSSKNVEFIYQSELPRQLDNLIAANDLKQAGPFGNYVLVRLYSVRDGVALSSCRVLQRKILALDLLHQQSGHTPTRPDEFSTVGSRNWSDVRCRFQFS
jgi:hypothetical protein